MWEEEIDLPKEKHVKRILDTLIGKGKLPIFDAYQKLIKYIKSI